MVAKLATGREKGPVLAWAIGLNLFLLAALVIAYVDRHTHAVAPLYLFRPAALTLLVSLLLLGHSALRLLPDVLRAGVSGITIVLLAVFALPDFVENTFEAATPGTLVSELDDFQLDLINWVQNNTAPDDPLLFTPWPDEFHIRHNISRLAMERMTGRPTIVDYKFVPTGQADLVRWYRLLKWRDLVFSTSCEAISAYPVAYLVTRGTYDGDFDSCADPIWKNEQFTVLEVKADMK